MCKRILAFALLVAACGDGVAGAAQSRLLFVGQDLRSIRGYLDSGCCPRPDGLTAYLSFYNLTVAERGYGGLGLDLGGEPTRREHSWGAGPVNAHATATGFGIRDLAVGLSLHASDGNGNLQGIVAGRYDANVDRLKTLFRAVEGTVYLRIGYEFDGSWNADYRDPDRYVAAYRRIVDRLRAVGGADNVVFVWQASASPLDDLMEGEHEDIARWFPGDDYVDWFAFSWFLHPHAAPSVGVDRLPPTPVELAREVLALARAAGKPVMIAEAAPQGFDLAKSTRGFIAETWDGPAAGGARRLTAAEIWNAWYGPMFELLHDNRDLIRALAYINCNWDAQPMWGAPYASGYWGDSRLETNPMIAERFRQAVSTWKRTDERHER